MKIDLYKAKKILNHKNQITIGKLLKTHGYKGQLKANIFIEIPSNINFIFTKYQGFILPLKIDYQNSTFDTSPQIIKFYRINDIENAKKIAGKDIYLPIDLLENEPFEIYDYNFFINFSLEKENKNLGKIISFIDNKANPLFEIKKDEKILHLPINALIINEILIKAKKIIVELKDINLLNLYQ